MSVAYYMEFAKGHQGTLDRIGGLPTHLPQAFPICSDSGQEMAFLAQLYASHDRFNVPGALCIQLYQCLGVDVMGILPCRMRSSTHEAAVG